MQSTKPVNFSTEQMKWYEQACARIDPKRLQNLLYTITNIHSPTGAARAASEHMKGYLENIGMAARYQPMSFTSGNVLAELRGSGGGASVLLYSPIDTHLELDEAEKILTGPADEADMQPSAQQIDDWFSALALPIPRV
jgi:hypothetical protein